MSWEEEDKKLSAAEAQARLEKKIAQRRREGEALEPLLPNAKRDLCTTFWGQAWNRHLAAHADYQGAMSPARTALRRGQVMDLQITAGEVRAVVAHGDLCEVHIAVKPLDEDLWAELKQACAGKIGSLLELLDGRLSDEVMREVTRPDGGLFPAPGAIRCRCTCEDYSDLCRHSAATLYGVGVKLDEAPALLFELRQVNPADLAAAVTGSLGEWELPDFAANADDLPMADLGELFGIDLGSDGKKE